MERGKTICNALKAVRQEIALCNDIDYSPVECNHKGDCLGTCPKCEEEVRYLEHQLSLRQAMGKAVSIVGVGVGLAALTACKTHKSVTPPEIPDPEGLIMPEVEHRLMGKPAAPREEWEQPAPADSTVADCPLHPVAIPADSTDEERLFGYIDEQMPAFPGGQQALLKYLEDNLRFPASMKEKGPYGRVIVKFVVEKDGTITNVNILRGLGAEADAEAMRVVREMPKWRPGKRSGEAVRVQYSLPVNFQKP